jgi:hypothetical protein|tara:strand:- start:291 stop:407 length:117 start_codon:yes stop_codon:yes gene_type:complete
MKISQIVGLILLLCFISSSLGCGKKGAPRPPKELFNSL